jgi:conjugative relaxase-like TrwC/TraI family protein
MLHVATVSDPRARYYLGDLGDELRRVAPGRAGDAGRWLGTASAAAGLAGEPDGPALEGLLAGRHPGTGRVLTTRRRSVAAYDLTFTVPKSLSVLFGLGGHEVSDLVAGAHRDAVDAAVDYMERRAAAVRRGTGAKRALSGSDGVLAAGFTHCLSRAGDPHLHTHVVVANLVHGSDGRWSALDGRGLFAHARAAGALHDAHLRALLTERMHVAWSWRAGGGWELAGSDPLVLAALSGRSAEIAQALWASGRSSGRARRVAWASTRGPKSTAVPGRQLRATWSRHAGGSPLDPPSGVRGEAKETDRLDEGRFAAAIADASPSGVCRRDVVAAWATASRAGVEGSELQEAVDHWAPSADCGIGVGEHRAAPVRYVPRPHLLSALGPRPVGVVGQKEWQAAAASIDRYRERWGVSGPSPLHQPGASLAAFPTARLVDHLEVSRVVSETLVRLGGRRPTALERDIPSIGR